jgi:hypothetical protein
MVAGVTGSIASTSGMIPRPMLAGLQLAPPFVVLKTPLLSDAA